MGWGPRFKHGIGNFYPEAILRDVGVAVTQSNYATLLERLKVIIIAEVEQTAKELNSLLQVEYRKDIMDIEEYAILGRYWMTLQIALNQPGQRGVTWDKGVVQAKFVDTDLLGGVRELQEIQHEAYPHASGNLAAWTNLYKQWLNGRSDKLLLTIVKRLDIMQSRGMAPFAELIETGNDMYPAYPTHGAKNTLASFKPTYRTKMREAYQRVLLLAYNLISATPISSTLIPASIIDAGIIRRGFSWYSRSGNIIFMLAGSQRIINGRQCGIGFILSPVGQILKKWSGWLPR